MNKTFLFCLMSTSFLITGSMHGDDNQDRNDRRIEDRAKQKVSRPSQDDQHRVRQQERNQKDSSDQNTRKKRDASSDEKRVRVGDDKNRVDRKKLKKREAEWRANGRKVRTRFVDDRKNKHIFDDSFWVSFRRHHKDWHFDKQFSWSAPASWANIVVWLPWQWKRPIYYYYSSNGSIYYGESQNASYLVPVSGKNFVAEAVKIANTPRPLSMDQASWMPLGMFALTHERSGANPSEYISLAVSKQGFISGAYINSQTGETLEIRGAVDSSSQRAAWKFVDKNWPIMETGLYNLTNEEATFLVHNVDGTTESRTIVRLD